MTQSVSQHDLDKEKVNQQRNVDSPQDAESNANENFANEKREKPQRQTDEDEVRKKAPLFRQQAVDAQNNRLDGSVFIADHITYRTIASFYFLIVLAVIVFVVFGSYARKVPVVGFLKPESGLSKVYTGASGEIAELYVTEGDVVQKGHALAKVISDGMNGENYALENVIKELEKSLGVLKGDSEQAEKEFQLEMQRMESEKKSASRMLALLDNQRKQILSKKHIISEKITSLEDLKQKGVISIAEFNNEKLKAHDMALELDRIDTAINEKKYKLAAIELAIKKLPIDKEIKMADIEREKSTTRQKLSETKLRHSSILVAPVDGRVTTMINKAGDRVGPNYPLMSILPEWSLMQAEIYVPASGISFVHEGQAISIQYQALPVQRYGTYPGKVISISETPINPQDIKDVPFKLDQSVYRVIASIQDQNITIDGKNFPIVPGMGVKISLLAEEQSILEWLLEPVWDVKERF